MIEKVEYLSFKQTWLKGSRVYFSTKVKGE